MIKNNLIKSVKNAIKKKTLVKNSMLEFISDVIDLTLFFRLLKIIKIFRFSP